MINHKEPIASAADVRNDTTTQNDNADVKNEKKHPIDAEVERMMDKDSSTAGMREAQIYAIREWDKLLNENYKLLLKKLKKDDQNTLRASQSAWIQYRDREFGFNKAFWSGFDGTMFILFPDAFQADFIKERALSLERYLKDLDLF
jgi:uncharacterized protein YecT (DUF1311 family)